MANYKKLDRLLVKAQKAYQKGDKRKGARLIEQILIEDFNHTGAWQLLHHLYGPGRLFEEFQQSFTLQYYPDKLDSLISPGEKSPEVPAPPPKKPSFFDRLFRRSSSAPITPESASTSGAQTPAFPADTSPEATLGPPAPPEGKSSSMTLLQSATQHDQAASYSSSQPSPPSPIYPVVAPSGRPVREESRPSIVSPPPPSPVSITPGPAPSPTTPGIPRDKHKFQVIVVDDIAQTRETVIRSLRFQEHIEVVGTATNGLQAIQLVSDLQPDVVVMDVNMPDMDGITATAEIKRLVPQVQIIILTVQDDIDYMRRAMMAGARDFLAKPPRIEELVEAVLRAGELAQKEKEKAPPVAAAPVVAVPSGAGKIISIYSPRGGSGCTTLASNLAVTLRSEDTKIILVDSNLQFGDLPVFFDVQSKNSIVDLAPRAAELDPEIIENVAIKHSSGVMIIPPPRPERAELVTGTHFSQLIGYLSELYPYVIIDTAHRMTDVTLAALDASDLIVLVITQDVPAIARMRKFFDLVPLLNLDTQRLMLVMNKFDQRVGITPEKVGQAFNQKMASVLPSAPEIVIPSVNRGVPFMLEKAMAARPLGRAMLGFTAGVRQQLSELKSLPKAVAIQTPTANP